MLGIHRFLGGGNEGHHFASGCVKAEERGDQLFPSHEAATAFMRVRKKLKNKTSLDLIISQHFMFNIEKEKKKAGD